MGVVNLTAISEFWSEARYVLSQTVDPYVITDTLIAVFTYLPTYLLTYYEFGQNSITGATSGGIKLQCTFYLHRWHSTNHIWSRTRSNSGFCFIPLWHVAVVFDVSSWSKKLSESWSSLMLYWLDFDSFYNGIALNVYITLLLLYRVHLNSP